MAIARRPLPSPLKSSRVDVEALINKGGSPPNAQTSAEHQDASSAVVLRIPNVLLEQIDASVKSRPIRTPRHTWLLEALHEKLSREQGRN
jgi:hypothetical protein